MLTTQIRLRYIQSWISIKDCQLLKIDYVCVLINSAAPSLYFEYVSMVFAQSHNYNNVLDDKETRFPRIEIRNFSRNTVKVN